MPVDRVVSEPVARLAAYSISKPMVPAVGPSLWGNIRERRGDLRGEPECFH